MSCVIFCLRIRGDHVESLPPSPKPGFGGQAPLVETPTGSPFCALKRPDVVETHVGAGPFSGRTQILLGYFRISKQYHIESGISSPSMS